MPTGALYRWFRATASRRPGAPAITFLRAGAPAGITYTYEQLFDRAEQLGDALASRYADRSAPLGILLGSQEDQVLHYLAGLHAGAVPAILTPPNRKLNRAYYRETMAAVLRRCRFGAVISDITDIVLPTRGLAPYTFDDLPGSPPSALEGGTTGRQLDASFMQFSSGTTGIKRGVLVSDEAVIAQLQTYAGILELDATDCILGWLPLYHDMGFIACLNMPLAHGVHTVMIDPIDWVSNPGTYLQAVSEYRGTLSWHPNFAYAFMAHRVRDADIDGVNLSSLRGLINCSEPATHESQQAFLDRFGARGLAADVFKGCYAMAETTFALTHGEPDDPRYLDPDGPTDGTRTASPAGYVSVGSPLPGVELAIRSPEDWQELSERVVGEIWVRSPFNFSRYYNDPEATARAWVDDWYRTGDLGYRVGEAYYVAGRLKDLLIVGGVNVFPQDIEDLVSRVKGVHPGRVCAFSAFDERLQTEHVVIVAESDHHDADDARRILLEVRQRVLAAFQIANFDARLVAPGWLVKSTSGKMARGANRQKWLAAVGSS
jgi:fatty-acyl-CoA synthase